MAGLEGVELAELEVEEEAGLLEVAGLDVVAGLLVEGAELEGMELWPMLLRILSHLLSG